jgi:hypothetical protein
MNRNTQIFLLFGVLHFAGVFLLPGIVADNSSIAFLGRNWGYHFLSYLPLPCIGLAYAAFAASLVPSVQTLALSAVSNVGTRLRSVGSTRLHRYQPAFDNRLMVAETEVPIPR